MPLDDLLNSVGPAPQPDPHPAQLGNEPLETGSIFDIALHRLSQPGAARPKLSEGEINSLAESLVDGWLHYFAHADASITWIDAEREHSLWLDDKTLVVGRIDAVGQTEDGQKFFGEWKTEKPPWRNRKDLWKTTWKMSPQSLTYGVFVDAVYPGLRRFTVRKAYKSQPPTFDCEWFRFSDEEIVWWKRELINTASEIRARRHAGAREVPWSPNFEHCFKYGPEYVCPRFHPACSKLQWNAPIEGSTVRESHLEVERKFLVENAGTFGQPMKKGVVILDATRVEKWMNCHERYRGEYELGVREPEGEALQVGSDFHNLLRIAYTQRIKK